MRVRDKYRVRQNLHVQRESGGVTHGCRCCARRFASLGYSEDIAICTDEMCSLVNVVLACGWMSLSIGLKHDGYLPVPIPSHHTAHIPLQLGQYPRS